MHRFPWRLYLEGKLLDDWIVVSSFSHVWLFQTPWTIAARLLLPWDFPGKNTGVGCHFLFQEIFLTQGWNSHLLHWQVGSLPLLHLGGRSSCRSEGGPLGTDSTAYLLHHCKHVGEAVSNITQQVENRFGPTVFFFPLKSVLINSNNVTENVTK